jgi:hypothetical protein
LLFSVVFHCYSRGRERRAKARKAAWRKAKFAARVRRRHCCFIVLNNAAVREAPHTPTARHDVRPQSGHAVPLWAG